MTTSGSESEDDFQLLNGMTVVLFTIRAQTVFGETVCVCGNVSALGSWKTRHAVTARTSSQSYPVWQAIAEIPTGTSISYKYIIRRGSKLVRYEALSHNRGVIVEGTNMSVDDGEFGNDGEQQRVLADYGWLTPEEVQLRVWLGHQIGEHYMGVTLHLYQPYRLRIRTLEPLGLFGKVWNGSWLAVLPVHKQWSFAVDIISNEDDHLIGRCILSHAEMIRFDARKGHIIRPVLNTNNISSIVHKLNCYSNSIPLYIGHRGSGGTARNRKKNAALTENTLLSFVEARQMGADYIEFDVQLTKDDSPVICHNLEVQIPTPSSTGDTMLVQVPLNKLKLAKLRSMKPRIGEDKTGFVPQVVPVRRRSNSSGALTQPTAPVVSENEPSEPDNKAKKQTDNVWKDGSFWLRSSNYPTLQETFQYVQSDLGFDVEIKYPENPAQERAFSIRERNVYVDAILTVIFDHAGSRPVFITSFDPDICLMCSLKQIKYPVLFLTTGGYENLNINAHDSRKNSVEAAIEFASHAHLTGIVSDARAIIDNPSLVHIAHKQKLLVLTYGGANDSPDSEKLQRESKVDGIISDHLFRIRPKHMPRISGNAQFLR